MINEPAINDFFAIDWLANNLALVDRFADNLAFVNGFANDFFTDNFSTINRLTNHFAFIDNVSHNARRASRASLSQDHFRITSDRSERCLQDRFVRCSFWIVGRDSHSEILRLVADRCFRNVVTWLAPGQMEFSRRVGLGFEYFFSVASHCDHCVGWDDFAGRIRQLKLPREFAIVLQVNLQRSRHVNVRRNKVGCSDFRRLNSGITALQLECT